jgi:hypothetical protein
VKYEKDCGISIAIHGRNSVLIATDYRVVCSSIIDYLDDIYRLLGIDFSMGYIRKYCPVCIE